MRQRQPRREQARTRLARAAIVDAAHRLFVERGYAATTIEAISDRSGVPPATVYRLFSSKHGILESVLDVTIGGDHQDVPMAERPEVRSALADRSPHDQLASLVAVVARVNDRVWQIYRVLVSAAASDPDAAALLDELTRQRQQGQRQFARALARSGSLRAGLRERDAADVIHALLSPELYRLLVVDRSWTTERYATWLTKLLAGQLLDR